MTHTLFALLRREVCGAAEELPLALSPDVLAELYRLASAHDVAHLAGQALSKCGCLGKDEASHQLKNAALGAVMRYVQLQHRYEQICAVLEEAALPFIPLKGAVLREWYPEPWMRTSCDVDILVQPERLEEAVGVLCEQLSCERGDTTSHDVTLRFTDGVQLELHYDTIESAVSASSAKVLQTVWDDAVPQAGYTYRRVMSDALFYAYHIAHMAKHFINGGCGIRPFLDLCVLARIPHDDTTRRALLAQCELTDFAAAAEHLSRVWFEGEPADDLSIQMEQYILHGGSYGTMDNYVTIHRAQQGGRWQYVWSRVWLRYDIIKFYYPVLQRHAWLTPLYQVIRWFKIALGRGAKSAAHELRRNAALSNDTVQSTQTLLQQLGLP